MLDLFSGGGGGWCLAAQSLGIRSVGIEIDGPACGTRAVVGLPTIRADVALYPPEPFIGKAEGICGGPPCQSFSSAGKRAGLADPRGQLVYEPMRYVRVIRPRWVALEQVPEVLGYWRWIARELREMGYSAWTGILNAADYGVPQVRRRAILLASLDRRAVPPVLTHSRSGADDLFGGGLPRWVTMAEALGWDGVVHTQTLTGPDGAREEYLRSTNRPAPVVRVNSGGRWCWERPSTTVQCDPRISKPGHHGESGQMQDAIPVEPWELGVLQGFPADHPWQPPYVSAQIGNAIPPPLAEACLRAIAVG